jgi:hypothetical protein
VRRPVPGQVLGNVTAKSLVIALEDYAAVLAGDQGMGICEAAGTSTRAASE